MKVIALLGSPRRNGNTDIMAEEVLRGAREAGAKTTILTKRKKKRIFMSDIVIQMAKVRPHRTSSVGCDGLAGCSVRINS